jgi:hypothetical protein
MLRAFKTVFHHELFHILDWVDAGSGDASAGYDDHAWRSINDKSHRYDNEKASATAYQDHLADYSLELGTGGRGFANSYQKSAVWEDKACLFAFLHTDQSALLRMCVLDGM